jgi:two-component system, sporulation sensor kinase E
MPTGGTITLESKQTDSGFMLSVEDTGMGIPEESIAKLWMPLFTTKPKGMGFGLSICKRIVEAHEGTIAVESEMGKGTKFTINLPNSKEK